MSVNVTLEEITEDTLDSILELNVAQGQKHLVAPNAVSIAQAHFSKEAWFRAIYADGEPVGFVMLSLNPKKNEYVLWRLMIDARHQKKGYGRLAVQKIVEFVRTLPGARELLTSYVPDEASARDFYTRLGFHETGLEEDGERIMSLPLE